MERWCCHQLVWAVWWETELWGNGSEDRSFVLDLKFKKPITFLGLSEFVKSKELEGTQLALM